MTQYVTWVNLLFLKQKLLWQAGAKKFRKQSETPNVALQYLEIRTILEPHYSLRAIHLPHVV